MKQSSWIREQTKVDGILTINNKILTWEVILCVELIIDRWTTKVKECHLMNYRSQGTQRTRWGDEIRTFFGAELCIH